MRKLTVAVVVAALAGIATAHARTYPTRPVTLIVPYPAGGPSDTLARVLAEGMRGPLGQPVIIENVSGAGAASAPGAWRVPRRTATRSASGTCRPTSSTVRRRI
jgi:tripartite-type tricarboxylate transporter receptor subunit TctC